MGIPLPWITFDNYGGDTSRSLIDYGCQSASTGKSTKGAYGFLGNIMVILSIDVGNTNGGGGKFLKGRKHHRSLLLAVKGCSVC